MKYIIPILSLGLCLNFSLANAQLKTNFTDALFKKHYDGLSLGNWQDNVQFNQGLASKLFDNGADCFIVTFELSPHHALRKREKVEVLKFEQFEKTTFTIGIEYSGDDGPRLYVGFPGPSSKTIVYEVFDNLNADSQNNPAGAYTVIVSAYFIGIAKDSQDGRWFFTPMFFGLDTNLPYSGLEETMKEYTAGSPETNPTMVIGDYIAESKVSLYMMWDADKHRSEKNRTPPYKLADAIYSLHKFVKGVENAKRGEEEMADYSLVGVDVNHFSIYPNPSNGILYVNLNEPSDYAGEVTLRLIDLQGNLVARETLTILKGYNGVRWDLSKSSNLVDDKVYILSILSPLGEENHQVLFNR